MRDDDEYWSAVERRALELNTDGCSGLLQWFRRFCWEHDIHYRTHKTLDGKKIGKWRSDWKFLWRHLRDSPEAAGIGSLRWIGLTFGGWVAWYKSHRGSPIAERCREDTPWSDGP